MNNESDWVNFLKHLNLDQHSDVFCGIGDDSALLKVRSGLLSTGGDFLIDGVHLPKDACAAEIAYKALARNISDVVATGARPKFYLVNLLVSSVNVDFMREIYQTFSSLNQEYGMYCVGGDTSRLKNFDARCLLSIHMFGYRHQKAKFWRRSDAKVGDDLYVTGCLGDAGLAFHLNQNENLNPALLERIYRPPIYVFLLDHLAPYVNGCIDISDGFIHDLSRLLQASACGAKLFFDALPFSAFVQKYIDDSNYWPMIFNGGDDYELLFSASPKHRGKIESVSRQLNISIKRVGYLSEKKFCINWASVLHEEKFKPVWGKILKYAYQAF